MDVFISWTSEDKDVKNALAEKLRNAGFEVWVSDEKCTSEFSEECIDAIHRCSVFIVIVSDASMGGGYVKNEIIEARKLEEAGKLNILVYKITENPYSSRFNFLLNHISFVTGNLIQRKSNISGDSGLDTIVQRTKTLLQKRKDGDPEKPFDVHTPQIDGLKIAKTGYFVEGSRDNELTSIEEAFQKSNVLVLTELFGFGKRSAVKKFVEKHKDEYSDAVIVHNEYGSLREFFLAGLDFSNVNEKIFENLESDALLNAKLKQLEKLDEKTLLVIPDVKSREPLDTSLCERLANLKCRIILMTQESADIYEDWFPVIQVGKMQDPYLQELFFHHYARACDDDKEALIAPLTKFFNDIGGHTKTVELTAASLGRDMGVMPEDIPDYLSMRGSEGLQLKDRIMRQIESVFDIEQLTRDQITALLVAACIAVPYISEKNYRAVLKNCGVEDWSIVVELDKRRWLDVDMQNRTVSMESLVARIILSKFPDSYFVFTKCMDYLEDNYIKMFSISTSRASNSKNMSKLEYFFTVTDLPECAQLAAQLGRFLVEERDYDTKKMADAIAQFEEKYPKTGLFSADTSADESNGILMDMIARVDLPYEAYHRNTFEQFVHFHISQLLPTAKLISLGIESLLLDFSSEGSRVMRLQQNDTSSFFDVEATLGMSREQMQQWLDALRASAQSDDEMDEDDLETLIITECCSLMDGLYNRDRDSLMLSTSSLLTQIDKKPEILQDKLCGDMIFAVLQMMSKMYLLSGAYSSAILFCEHVLSYPAAPIKRTMILQIYIPAMHHSSLFTQKLFDAYRELLQGYDKMAGDVFDGRADMLQEKKGLLLMYAADLACGERLEEAQQQFAAAWKIGKDSLLDETAQCAQKIVDVSIKTGDFSQAVEFIYQYFTLDVIDKFAQLGSDETRKIMDDFIIYQNAGQFTDSDFTSNPDPTKHISYYHAFSRKNNGLLEQKYLSVADRAMDFDFSDLTAEEIALHAQELAKRARKENILRLAPEAFALASEAGYRVLGYRHHYVQYMGAAAMADGKIAEILNGEGKTYTIVLTAFLRSLYGECVFVVDQSPYLTNRNYTWMKGIYDLLGVPNRYVRAKEYPSELNHGIIYIDLNELIFTYLRRGVVDRASRGDVLLDSVIIDEIDTTLVDGAETPYRIARYVDAPWLLRWHELAWEIAKKVLYDETYYTYTNKWIVLNPNIYPLLERTFGISYADIASLEKIREIEKIVKTAILCCGHYEKGRDFFIHQGVPVQENKEKGIFAPFSTIYLYFLCKDNDLDARKAEKSLVSVQKIQNAVTARDFFKKFKFVSGTTATAVSFRDEFKDIYSLDYVSVPPHSPCIRDDRVSPVYTTMRAKDQAMLKMIKEKNAAGQPILVITQSIEESEKYSRLLKRNGIDHKLLNAKNADESMDIIANAGIPGSVLVTNALVGRGADIKLGGDPERKTRLELVDMGEDVTDLDSFLYSLPTPEQKETALFKKYYSVLGKHKAYCAADRQAVVEAGGLCVIGTSFFPEPRTEQQTRGRSGRQGDVGESWVFLSLEDESLNSFLPAGYLAWVHSYLGDVEELDASALHKAINNAQKALHKNKFSKIRNLNSNESYIDKARADFLGKRFDLKEGILTAEDILKEWASDKTVLQELQKLQKGEPSCGIKVLEYLWNNYPQLQTARGGRAASVLFSVADEYLTEKFKGLDLTSVIYNNLLYAWETFIGITQDSVGKVDMKDRALERYLEEEKRRLLRQPVEQLLAAQIVKK